MKEIRTPKTVKEIEKILNEEYETGLARADMTTYIWVLQSISKSRDEYIKKATTLSNYFRKKGYFFCFEQAIRFENTTLLA